ncbi:kinase-like domain-containing protein [Gigaspora rosea]|uniref:Kinase-like domain-containing protein n=1 Tax=Gigaspora rosea TaxID=44941 RepID=A0A397ULT7_9GLOM|nr:kinase-like domain-containing protein [Gigaspora rosea]
MFNVHITDFGLYKLVSQDSSSKVLFDIYSFGIITSEIFTGYPPYYNFSHDNKLATKICYGLRPKIRYEVPQLLLDLMNECLDAEPQNRSTAKEIDDTLVQNIKGLDKNFITYYQVKYQTHPQANYTSRLLDLSKLPKSGSQPIDYEIPDGK